MEGRQWLAASGSRVGSVCHRCAGKERVAGRLILVDIYSVQLHTITTYNTSQLGEL